MTIAAGVTLVVFLVVVISLASSTSMAAKDHKPRRGKHYIPSHKVGTVESVEVGDRYADVQEEKSFFDEVKNDAKLKGWLRWWHSCAGKFSMDDFVDAGVSSLAGQWSSYDKQEIAGPNKEFCVRCSGYTINPVWGRMRYVKNGKQWQAQMRPAFCGVMIYKGDKARKVIQCGELDGVSQVFCTGKNRFVVTSYRKMTPEMNVECKATEVGSCVAPIIWLVDLNADTVWEYRGPVVTFKRCEPNDFLVDRYPSFFVRENSSSK